MKHVLIVSPEYPTRNNKGGVATFVESLAQLLNKLEPNKIQVQVLTYDLKAKKAYQKLESGVLINYIPTTSPWGFLNFLYCKTPIVILRNALSKKMPFLVQSFEWNLWSSIYFLQLNRKYSFALIHSFVFQVPSFFLNLFISQQKIIFHLHGPQFLSNAYERKNLDRKLMANLEKFVLKRARHKIACSHFLAKKISLPSKVIYNFCNWQVKARKQKIDKNLLIYFGRMDYRKGVDLLIKAFVELATDNKKLKLILVGNAGADFLFKDQRLDFQSWLKKQNISAEITKRIKQNPPLSRKKIQSFLEVNKGIVVLPARFEPFGFTTIESMLTGQIVVTSQLGAGGEIIDNEQDGFLLKKNNVKSIEKTILSIQKLSQKQLSAVSTKAQEKVESKFSEEALLSAYQKFYKNLGLI